MRGDWNQVIFGSKGNGDINGALRYDGEIACNEVQWQDFEKFTF